MKGFSGILVLFIFLTASIILLSATYQTNSNDNSLSTVPKIKNLYSLYGLNVKNMASDCNWMLQKEEVKSCLFNGINIIFEKTNLDPLILCARPTLEEVDENEYYVDLNCTNRIILEKNTNFTVQNRVTIISPLK